MVVSSVSAGLQRLRPVLLVGYLALMGTACVVAASLYLGLPLSPAACLVSIGTIFGIYMVNRYTDMREDFANDSYRSVFFAQRKGILRLVVGVLAAVVVVLVACGKLNLYFMALLLVGMVYSCKLIPWYSRGKGLVFVRLKEVPLMKNVLVALLWGLSVFAVPIIFAGSSLDGPGLLCVAVLTAAMMLSTLNNTVFGDVLDVEGDRFAGTRTLPVLVGVRATLVGLAVVNALWLGMVVGLAVTRVLDDALLVFLGVLACYPAAYLLPYWRKWVRREALEFVCESDLLVFAVGLSVLTLV